VKGEVISSTFDRPARTTTPSPELAVSARQAAVELGHDVVLLLLHHPPGPRLQPGGARLRRILSVVSTRSALYRRSGLRRGGNIGTAARLTILATALVETGSRWTR